MPRGPTNHWKPWTPEEVDTLMRLISEGVSKRLIAKELDRTQEAVERRAQVEKAARKIPSPPGRTS